MDRYKKQRARMVETQIRARQIRDDRVLKVMETVPRHLFVDEGLINQAYSDNPLPTGERQTISQPVSYTPPTLLTNREDLFYARPFSLTTFI
jgi:protein-L-isoaspartate(D-aspartate) O-methyltransferase